MSEHKTKVYFPGLNGLRFFAALAVIITHVEMLKTMIGLRSRWNEPVFFNLGGLGVYFFFVLSGFLITYLLLSEKKQEGRISVRAFYLRRIFRIWPVYYLLIFAGFFIFPHISFLHLDYFQKFLPQHFWFKFGLFFFMLPNLALAMFPSVPHIGQTWSIGVEEQFYIIWPWIAKKFSNLFRVLIIFIILIVALKCAMLVLVHFIPHNYWINSIKAFIAMTKMECMAIGGLGACLLFNKKEKFLKLIYLPVVQLSAYILIPLLIFFTPEAIQDGIHLFYSVLFLVIIMNVSSNTKSLLKLENRVFNLLGNVSYGMYMYHMFVLVFVIRLSSFTFGLRGIEADIAHYGLGIAGTVLISILSYYIYERTFIRMKKKFTKVMSGNEAKSAQ
ncbi:MAG: acyltransferase [Bacteroidetes bacterium]|nr:acyltransferase [Bacteroidota bacterium]